MLTTKPRFMIEESPPPNPEQQTLKDTLAILMPIRAHRQFKSEQQWREAKLKLKQIEQQIEEMEAHLESQKQEHLTRRQELSDTHQSQTLNQKNLNEWIGEEKQLLVKLDTINRELNALHQTLQKQQEIEQQAKAQVQVKQRDLERLTTLKNEIEEAL